VRTDALSRAERRTRPALHLYQQCAALLKKELGIQPSAATRITYREILELDAGGPADPRAAADGSLSARRSTIRMAGAADRVALGRPPAGRVCASFAAKRESARPDSPRN
jgi:DNA-binding SARP family transcriptional activator